VEAAQQRDTRILRVDDPAWNAQVRRTLRRTLRAVELILLAAAVGVANSCTKQESTPAPTAVSAKTSLVCEAVLGHFVGLSAESSGAGADAPAAGRWWVRQCDFGSSGGELYVRLGGPAWFWVERKEPPFQLRDYVYFRVDSELWGTIEKRIGWKDGRVSLWFRTTHARVKVEPLGEIHPSSDNAVVSVLRFLASPIPALNVDSHARARVEAEVTERFQSALARGFTMIYDIRRDQPDFALGLLAEGAVPEHPFAYGRPWLANERLIAAPGGVHVLGPFEPDEALSLDARITRGSGLAWRLVCASDLERAFAAVEHGEPARIPNTEIRHAGTLSGPGLREAKLTETGCRYYVVVSPAGQEISHAAVRVRHS
jgi:hypothetical protein